ncbi:MAG TPA: alpha/beta hydrolase [Candidatus Faecousia intestinigallinarum]|nr:alpha/beta hydrolase [Candidatus Faecousia intestinigallinarum]
MNRQRAKLILGIAAGTLSLYSVAHQRFTEKMAKIAMDRDPAPMRWGKVRISGSAELESRSQLLHQAAQRLESRNCEIVVIQGKDGVRLVGHWRGSECPERVIIAMHGWRSSWSQDFGCIADFWHSHHCAVLYAEQRGQNNSGGACISFGLLERYDCLAWANWAGERTGGRLPIYLAGTSMGATTVLMAADLGLPPCVCGIAADSAFTSPPAIWKYVSENNLHIPYAPYRAGVARQCRRRTGMAADAASTTQALAHCRVPVFLIHGADDRFVPVEMCYENYKACPGSKRLLIVPGADHCMSYLLERETYEQMTKEFWERCERRWQQEKLRS